APLAAVAALGEERAGAGGRHRRPGGLAGRRTAARAARNARRSLLHAAGGAAGLRLPAGAALPGGRGGGGGGRLHAPWPVFRRELDACADLLAPLLGADLRQALFPPAARRAVAAGE